MPRYSPDGKYLSYVRDPGTDMIIQQKLNHGGPSDLYIRPVAGGAADQPHRGAGISSPGRRAGRPTAGSSTSRRPSAASRTCSGRRCRPAASSRSRTGQRRIGGPHLRQGDDDASPTPSACTTRRRSVYVANIDGTRRAPADRRQRGHRRARSRFSKAERLQLAEQGRHARSKAGCCSRTATIAAKGPYPLIVFSHGGPHAATGYAFDFKKQYFAANGYFVLDTNFRSSTGYGEAFKWATWGAWGDKDGEDVIAGIDYVLERYPIDPKRVGHTGHSYGGFMTNWLITQYPDRFAAAITGAGITNWISDYGTADIYRTKETEFFGTPWDPAARERMIKQSPLTYAGRVKTPTLFVHGEVDQRVPYEEGEQMYFALKRRGVPAKMIQYAGQPHGIAGHWNNVHRMLNELGWWKRYLKGVKGATPTTQLPTVRVDPVAGLPHAWGWELRSCANCRAKLSPASLPAAARARQRLARQLLVAHRGVVGEDGDDGRLLHHVVALHAIETVHVRVVRARVVFEPIDHELEAGQADVVERDVIGRGDRARTERRRRRGP